MAVYTEPFVVLGVVSFLLMAGMAAWTFRARDAPGVLSYAVLAGMVGVWSLCYVPQLLATDVAGKLFWLKLRNTLSHGIVLAWLVFALKYTGREDYLEPRYLAPVAGVSVALVIPVWVTDWFVAEAVLVQRGSLLLVDLEFGLFFWVYVLYLYAVITVGLNLLASTFLGALRIYRMQATALFLAVLLPFIGSGLYMTEHLAFLPDLNPFQDVELTPYAFGFSAVLIGWSFFNYRFLDIAPIARSTVVEKLEDGVIVLDREDTIVDVNEAATRMVGMDERALLGSSIGDVLSQYSEVVQHYRGVMDSVNDEIVIDRGGVKRYLDLNISPIGGDRQAGRVVLLRDVTRRKRNEEELRRKNMELERQNEQLDEFAAVVSHDLRNPLNVVEGYLPMARDGDPEAFEAIDESVDRMKEIVDDVLMLARQGQSVTETMQVDLDEIAHSAWSTVDTGDAELVVRTGAGVEADRARLLHVFENLFRNSVEHGSTDKRTESDDSVEDGGNVRIEMGPLENGFYVEDDGPGIPEGERTKVLGHGYTTTDGGTGFGLSIVRSIVEAHGWEITVDESSEGGARFEITGVEESPVGLE